MNLDLKYLYSLGNNILINEPMKKHTTFKIGGIVPYYIIPKTKNIFINTLNYIIEKNINFKIIGGGANLLINDSTLNFIVLSTEYLTGYSVKENILYSEVGIPISRLSYIAMENSLSGLEFASGIPGTLGGALFMNAGAYGGQISDVILNVEVYDTKEKKTHILEKDLLNFNYRKSIFHERKYIALSAYIKLNKKDKKEIENKMKDLSIKRWEKQPLEYPSAGSFFKRPRPNFYVGTTIEKLGLKGYSIGDAEISNKHAGFIINKGNAKFEDVIKLSEYVKKIVKESYGEDLEIEPEIWW
ncbi:UDP-N-acetylmuramate dehydrogenase [Marinitoga sp. 38H-ov]|uniref:UDP-N-acetylmuramate dehydrogenase n=1 Tax=Marinitoga sp. 38H-ov TaxID=1755814 RepID=UPI0016A9781F|nr:UDP-N-acetylmuramate dehydrogenase [Marinitoga sp. 38H-ov]KAF2955508.1 UDP-N-acetylenolpyruvoylglucosamine reductase [Marinitoga sp. 38H-ov]